MKSISVNLLYVMDYYLPKILYEANICYDVSLLILKYLQSINKISMAYNEFYKYFKKSQNTSLGIQVLILRVGSGQAV